MPLFLLAYRFEVAMKTLKLTAYFLFLLKMIYGGQSYSVEQKWDQIDRLTKKRGFFKTSILFYRKKMYNASLFYLRRDLKSRNSKVTDKKLKLLDRLINKTGKGLDLINGIEFKRIQKYPSILFHLGLNLYKRKRFSESLNILSNIQENQKYYTESLMMMGTIHYLYKKFEKSEPYFEGCKKNARIKRKLAHKSKLKKYYFILEDTCQINLARMSFEQNKYNDSLKSYKKIKKRSYLWPYTLKEKAWIHFKKDEFNMALGLLVTLNSPLLSNYITPEVEYLKALTYFKMCLYDDSLSVITNFEKNINAKRKRLKSFLGHSNLFNLISKKTSIKKADKISIWGQELFKRIRKQVKFNVKLARTNRLKREIRILNKLEMKYSFHPSLKGFLQKAKDDLSIEMNDYIKSEITTLDRNISKFVDEFFSIKIDVLAQKRKRLYAKKLKSKFRQRGELKNINVSSNVHFYSFGGEFWADELGDYSFALKSKCKMN